MFAGRVDPGLQSGQSSSRTTRSRAKSQFRERLGKEKDLSNRDREIMAA